MRYHWGLAVGHTYARREPGSSISIPPETDPVNPSSDSSEAGQLSEPLDSVVEEEVERNMESLSGDEDASSDSDSDSDSDCSSASWRSDDLSENELLGMDDMYPNDW